MRMESATESDEIVRRQDRGGSDQEPRSTRESEDEFADIPTRLGRQPRITPNTSNDDSEIGKPRQPLEDQIGIQEVVNQLREERRCEPGEGIPEASGGNTEETPPAISANTQKDNCHVHQ